MDYAPPRHGFRTFVVVWAAESLSVIGSGMTSFALNVYLTQVLYPAPDQRAELAVAFTVLNLGFTIPFVFGGPVAGAWVDRHDRKRIMIASNTVSGLTTLLTFIFMLTGNIQLWMLEPLTSGVPRSTDTSERSRHVAKVPIAPERTEPHGWAASHIGE
jgi:MFS transporter, DHA3 family, macrolide efflux protein